ncbi:MAG: DUF547 domain-containing protein [Candidatus Melainabacteria bacterium]
MRRWLLPLLLVFCLVTPLVWAAQRLNRGAQAGYYASQDFFSHHPWQRVLNQSMRPDGRLDLNQLKANPAPLNAYLAKLAMVSPESNPVLFPDKTDQLAYWINAHNALALRQIVNYYPVRQLEDMPTFWSDSRYRFGGRLYSLGAIREKLKQELFQVPESYFLLSTLTASSPPLVSTALNSSNLMPLAKQQATAWVAQTTKVVSGECATVLLSPHFRIFQQPIVKYMDYAAKLPSLSEEDLLEKLTETGRGDKQQPEGANALLAFIKPLVGPDAYALIHKDCAHPVRFLDEDNTLVQVVLPPARRQPVSPMPPAP